VKVAIVFNGSAIRAARRASGASHVLIEWDFIIPIFIVVVLFMWWWLLLVVFVAVVVFGLFGFTGLVGEMRWEGWD
jgi:hypothetical protein